jgi:hypothetical protein
VLTEQADDPAVCFTNCYVVCVCVRACVRVECHGEAVSRLRIGYGWKYRMKESAGTKTMAFSFVLSNV